MKKIILGSTTQHLSVDSVLLKVILIVHCQGLLRGLDDQDHFKTLSLSFKTRALYKNIGKFPTIKNKICGFFITK